MTAVEPVKRRWGDGLRDPVTNRPLSSAPNRARFLLCVEAGANFSQAADACGVTKAGYGSWRKMHPDWWGKVLTARQSAKISNRRWVDDGSIQPLLPVGPPEVEKMDFADKRYFYFGYLSYWHHHRMIEAIEAAPVGGITLILVAPEHGKTTVIADWISVAIGESPNIRIAYVSEGLGLARKALGRQQRRMEPEAAVRYNRYHAAYGPFHEDGRDTRPWAKDFFTVVRSTHDEQDYTLECRGWTSAIAGSRVDLLIIDDIQSLRSISQTDDMIERFRQDFLSRVGKEGKIIVVGTRVAENDVYAKLIELDLVDRLVELPATDGTLSACPLGEKCDLQHIPHETPLCPEMWPVHDLARKRKQVGEAAWWRNYQQRPRNSVDATFTEDLVQACRNPMETTFSLRERTPGWRRFAGLDPSLRGGNSLIGVEATGARIRVLGISRNFDMVRTEAIIGDIDLHWKMWRYTDLIIEVNAFQKALGEDQRLRNLARLRGFRIHQHTTGVNKIDPQFGVASMASTFMDCAIEWPWGDVVSQSQLGMLESELLAWRDNVPTRKLRQDTVMSLWFCWLWWQRRRKGWLEEDAKVGGIQGRQGVPWPVRGYEAVTAMARALR